MRLSTIALSLLAALVPSVLAAESSSSSPTHTPIVPVSAKCYKDESALKNATANCNGHGSPIKSLRGCYACSCSPSKSKGRTTYWTGADCEREDISSCALSLCRAGLTESVSLSS